jgi:hypothetical protein
MEDQAKFEGWAKVEVMGHQSHVGHVTTQAFGGAVLFRIDRPGLPEEEVTLEHSEWVGDKRAPAGSVIKKPALEPVSVLVGAASIYRIVPCTEAAAMAAIRNTTRPLMLVKLAELAALPPGTASDGLPVDSDDENDDPYEDEHQDVEF